MIIFVTNDPYVQLTVEPRIPASTPLSLPAADFHEHADACPGQTDMIMLDDNRNLGIQPLDRIMIEHAMTNHTLVDASTEMITHKMVQRARKGRRLTKRTQEKVLRALQRAVPQQPFERSDVFTYLGE